MRRYKTKGIYASQKSKVTLCIYVFEETNVAQILMSPITVQATNVELGINPGGE